MESKIYIRCEHEDGRTGPDDCRKAEKDPAAQLIKTFQKKRV